MLKPACLNESYLSVLPILNSIPKSSFLRKAITGNMLSDGSISLS
jgi:hypothetical protein